MALNRNGESQNVSDSKEKDPTFKTEPSLDSDADRLRAELAAVKKELSEREQDLDVYRSELERVNQTLENLIEQATADLRMSQGLQKILVPTEFPNIPGFEFSTRFVASQVSGGDYFDIFELEDRMKFGIVMASASGYGMSSLLLSVLLKFTGHEEARGGMDPGAFVSFVKSELARLGAKPNDRAALFYGIIDRRNLSFKYASAGRFVGGLMRSATNEFEAFKAGAPEFAMLGALAQDTAVAHDFPQFNTVLEARDRLILSSQGVIAVEAPDKGAFGEPRFIGILNKLMRDSENRIGPVDVHQVRNEILYQAEKFAAGTPYPRDLTVVVAEVKDRVIRLAGRRKKE